MRKTKTEARQTREALLAAALDVFYRRGVSRASLQEIAATAGLTRGALYWHFKNKEDLLDALFQQAFSALGQQLDQAVAEEAPDLWHTLTQATKEVFSRLNRDGAYRKFCHVIHLNCENTEDNQTVTRLLLQYQRLWQTRLEQVFRLLIRQGQLPSDTDVDLAVIHCQSALMGLMDLWLMAPQRFDLNSVAPKIIDTTLNALRHSPLLRQDCQ